MSDITSNPQGGLDWEDVCLDMHHVSLEDGRSQGREAGASAGFREGEGLGQVKGLEYGIELGFYRGVLAALIKRTHTERIQKSLKNFENAIGDFPSADELFDYFDASDMKTNLQRAVNDDSEDNARFDILHKMQRIRARYKLLMVQLGMPLLSLRSSLEATDSGASPTESDGW